MLKYCKIRPCDIDLWPYSLKFYRGFAVVDVRVKFRRTKCSGSWVIVLTDRQTDKSELCENNTTADSHYSGECVCWTAARDAEADGVGSMARRTSQEGDRMRWAWFVSRAAGSHQALGRDAGKPAPTGRLVASARRAHPRMNSLQDNELICTLCCTVLVKFEEMFANI